MFPTRYSRSSSDTFVSIDIHLAHKCHVSPICLVIVWTFRADVVLWHWYQGHPACLSLCSNIWSAFPVRTFSTFKISFEFYTFNFKRIGVWDDEHTAFGPSGKLPIVLCNKVSKGWGAAIAQWNRLHLTSCRPGFESKAHHLCFYHL